MPLLRSSCHSDSETVSWSDGSWLFPKAVNLLEVEMYRASVEAFGEADGQRRSVEFGKAGRALRELVHDGSLGGGNGVAILGRFLGGDTPAVNHD